MLDPAPTASIHGPSLSTSTPTSPVRLTPAPLRSAQLAPVPLPPPEPRPESVTFGPGIAEALLYATREHASYPPSIAPLIDNLVATAKSTAREILSTPSLVLFLASKQHNTLGGLPEGVTHPAADLLQAYVEEGIPAHTAPPWSLQALETAISKGPHSSACTPEMTVFTRENMQRRIKNGFSILLLATDAIGIFRENLKLSRIAAMPQAHRRACLILNPSAQPDLDTPIVNETTNREAAPESLQFGRACPLIL